MGQHICQNKGCSQGNVFFMEPREEIWHMEKFGRLPKSCKSCRAWKESQVDIKCRCGACGLTFEITKETIIGHHRYIGAWSKPEYCRLCDEDSIRRERQRLKVGSERMLEQYYQGKARHPKSELLDEPKKRWFGGRERRRIKRSREYIKSWLEASYLARNGRPISQEYLQHLSSRWGTTSVSVETDPNFYKKLADPRHGTAHQHVMRHYEKSKDLSRLGAKNDTEVFKRLDQIASSDDPDKVIDFRDTESGYLVKYHIETETVVVIHDRQRHSVDKGPPPPPAYVRTSVGKSLSGVGRKISDTASRSDGATSSAWIPNVIA